MKKLIMKGNIYHGRFMLTNFSFFDKKLHILMGIMTFISNARCMVTHSSLGIGQGVANYSHICVSPYNYNNLQMPIFLNCGGTINGNVYNVLNYFPQITYVSYSPIYNLSQGNLSQRTSSRGNSSQRDLSQRDSSQRDSSRRLEILPSDTSTKLKIHFKPKVSAEKSNANDKLEKEFCENSSISWSSSKQSLDRLIDSDTYKTEILEINKLDNKRFQNSDDILMEKMQNTMCNNNVAEKKQLQLNLKPIKTEVAETVLKGLAHIHIPGFLG